MDKSSVTFQLVDQAKANGFQPLMVSVEGVQTETRFTGHRSPAMTFNQVRRDIASIIRVTYEGDSPRVVNLRTTQRQDSN